jgi:hypothetical protein
MEALTHIENDDVVRLQLVLQKHPDINMVSLLIYACHEKSYSCVRYLVCMGVNPYKKNREGVSAYSLAVKDETMLSAIQCYMPQKKGRFS